MAALSEQAVPSAVNKTIANLWACRTDLHGPWITEELADGSPMRSSLLGYTLVPGTAETYLDHSLSSSRGRSTLAFCYQHAGEVADAYIQHLQEVVTSGFRGLRQRLGGLVLALFGLQLVLSLAHDREWHTLALAGGALAHYLGPVVLIAGNEPAHYLLVAYPLFVVVAVRGAVALSELLVGCSERSWPTLVLGLVLLVIVSRSILFHEAAATQLRSLQQQALREQAAMDALELGGRRVACRNMCWFVDRDVQTIFLPYATVPELESYVLAHRIDGILIWEHEPTAAFRANPYGSLLDFGRALQDSGRFDPPQVSGAWRWYPVRHRKE